MYPFCLLPSCDFPIVCSMVAPKGETGLAPPPDPRFPGCFCTEENSRMPNGRFLLKTRAQRKNDPFKVAFAHQLQWQLAQREFPLPQSIGTKQDANSML